MIQKTLFVALICYSLLFLGVCPELYALNIASSANFNDETDIQTEQISSVLAAGSLHFSADEIRGLLPKEEISTNADLDITGGGYYTSGSSNQYSSFFGNAEAFLTELVEFFLFLALLSYVVGYEEWLPWEQSDE